MLFCVNYWRKESLGEENRLFVMKKAKYFFVTADIIDYVKDEQAKGRLSERS